MTLEPITDIDIRCVQNWLITHIAGAREKSNEWMGRNRILVYHACTLLIVFHLWAKNSDGADLTALLEKAWELQNSPDDHLRSDLVVDIDMEVIRDLEYQMFEEGNRDEWGLDIGTHQDE